MAPRKVTTHAKHIHTLADELTKDEVLAVQNALIGELPKGEGDKPAINNDKIYGTETHKAVEAFRAKYNEAHKSDDGFTPLGKGPLDEATLAALQQDQVLAGLKLRKRQSGSPDLTDKLTEDEVGVVKQTIKKALGDDYTGPIDDAKNPKAIASEAVKAAQTAYHLTPTGKVDTATLSALDVGSVINAHKNFDAPPISSKVYAAQQVLYARNDDGTQPYGKRADGTFERPDGIANGEFTKALSQFQKYYNALADNDPKKVKDDKGAIIKLDESGKLDDATIKVMNTSYDGTIHDPLKITRPVQDAATALVGTALDDPKKTVRDFQTANDILPTGHAGGDTALAAIDAVVSKYAAAPGSLTAEAKAAADKARDSLSGVLRAAEAPGYSGEFDKSNKAIISHFKEQMGDKVIDGQTADDIIKAAAPASSKPRSTAAK